MSTKIKGDAMNLRRAFTKCHQTYIYSIFWLEIGWVLSFSIKVWYIPIFLCKVDSTLEIFKWTDYISWLLSFCSCLIDCCAKQVTPCPLLISVPMTVDSMQFIKFSNEQFDFFGFGCHFCKENDKSDKNCHTSFWRIFLQNCRKPKI